jgi:hypothetical protein
MALRSVKKIPILLSTFLLLISAYGRYMLDAIGAGATAKTSQDWSKKWKGSEECKKITDEVAEICNDRKNAEISRFVKDQREYAMPLSTQIVAVTKRSFTSYWRDPNYLLGKYTPHLTTVNIDSSFTWLLDCSTLSRSGCYPTAKSTCKTAFSQSS